MSAEGIVPQEQKLSPDGRLGVLGGIVSTFNFQDGNGPVPAHQHKNPDGTLGGWVAETARVSGNARVYGDATILWGHSLGYDWTAWVDDKGKRWLVYGCECHLLTAWAKLHAPLAREHETKERATYAKSTRALGLFVGATLKAKAKS